MFNDEDDDCFLRLKHRLFHLTIREAAELVAVDMWASGEFEDIDEPKEWDGSDRDPILISLLDEKIKNLESKIFAAVDSKKLKAKNVVRDFEENLIASQPRIYWRDLDAWLERHGYTSGETFTNWVRDEVEIDGKLGEEFDYLRALSRDSKGVIEELPVIRDFLPIRIDDVLQNKEVDQIIAAYKAIVISHDRLLQMVYGGNEQPPPKEPDAKIDRPVTTRQRRTLLTIIAAFCKYEGIDPKARDAVAQIVQMTEDLSVPISDDTVRATLKDIPDALEARMK